MNKNRRYVDILLHGLFFMEFDTCGLTATAPSTEMHHYSCGVNGFLMELSEPSKSVTINLRSKLSGLTDGCARSFANYPQIPQFSKKSAGTGDIVAPGALQLLLKYPDDILPLRCGSLHDFGNVVDDGPVKTSIMNCCAKGGDRFALVTCLRYQAEPSYFAPLETTYCFYAQHTCQPTASAMNKAYSDAGAIFANKEFRLHLSDQTPSLVAPSSTDECSLGELLNGGQRRVAEGINVANCVQFGVSG